MAALEKVVMPVPGLLMVIAPVPLMTPPIVVFPVLVFEMVRGWALVATFVTVRRFGEAFCHVCAASSATGADIVRVEA
ncbi:MAG: hypothetical protein V4710_24640, partial [Verrucomicrobiota bacterium]